MQAQLFQLRRAGHTYAVRDLTLDQAHRLLTLLAEDEGLDVRLHTGSWAGTAVSTAYAKNGDNFTDAELAVVPQRN